MNTLSQSSAFDMACERILRPNGLATGDIARVLAHAADRRVDDADVYLEWSCRESFNLQDGAVNSGSFDISQGFGVRTVVGERSGLSHASSLQPDAMLRAAAASRAIADDRRGASMQAVHALAAAPLPDRPLLYATANPLGSLAQADKITLLERVDRLARQSDARVTKVDASLWAAFKVVLVARLDGRLVADARPMVTLSVSLLARSGERVERGRASLSLRADYAAFTQDKVAACVARAVREALINLEAVPARGETMDVVMGPGATGVLLHEAVGHGLEADFIRKGESLYAGRLGEQVTACGITIVDDGTLAGSRGSLNVDDEGNETRCTTLIDDGVLTGFMQDSLNARLMNQTVTGNGRRESYAALTLPRMTNTYMHGGTREPQEIIASVKRGLYVEETGGGEVDITNGNFVFSTRLAWAIENGRLTHPVKGATLVGNGPQALQNIGLVGNDLQMGDGGATCGKAGQSVPVGLGQPSLRIDRLTVGGAT